MWDPSMVSWVLYCLLPDWGCVASGKLSCFIFFTLPLENKGRPKACFLQEKPVPATSSLVWSKCAFAMESANCCCSPACGWASRVCFEVVESKAELRGPAGWLAGMCFPHPTCRGCGNKCLGSASGPECTWVSLPWGGASTCAEWRVYLWHEGLLDGMWAHNQGWWWQQCKATPEEHGIIQGWGGCHRTSVSHPSSLMGSNETLERYSFFQIK